MYDTNLISQEPTKKPSSGSSTASTISSAAESALAIYQAYQAMKQAPDAVIPQRGGFEMPVTAQGFRKKEGY